VSLLLNASSVTKSFGSAPLFRDVSLTVKEGDRLGVIGPNGSGKSTLLRMLAGEIEPDSGEVVLRGLTRLVYVPQDSVFPEGRSVRDTMRDSLRGAGVAESEWAAREAETLGRAGFRDFEVDASQLSGGWRKRLAIAAALVQRPDVLLLDEPTNHLDLAGIDWLEQMLSQAPYACVTVSHDRYFLENVPNRMCELNRAYAGGLFQAPGNYSAFLEMKAEHLHAVAKRQSALENRVRTELEWLRRGPKARATKAKARIDQAGEMIAELAEMKSRAQTSKANIDFVGSGQKSKRLVHFEGVKFAFDVPLIDGLDFTVMSGTRVGLVGANGSGKTTLLRLLRGEIAPVEGTIERADGLRIVYFDQKRELGGGVTLRRALAPDSDSVIYRGQVIHVASWAARFLFSNDQLDQPIETLSGGERARVLIAKLMLEPAGLLLLDEPTNDLDIPTLEVLEEALLEFEGAMVLVTHDRYLLDRVSTVVLGLDPGGRPGRFADYSQWAAEVGNRKPVKPKAAVAEPAVVKEPSKKKLSYKDAREFEGMEAAIAAAEEALQAKRDSLQEVAMNDPRSLERLYAEIEEGQLAVDALYARWAELEERAG
jgi:ATP-binding cassette subfamily F protein uup